MGRSLEYRVLSEDAGMTLEKILFQRLGLTVRQIRRSKFREDGICVNGQRSRVSTVLKDGDLVTVQIGDLPKAEEYSGSPEEAGSFGEDLLQILYEDEDILAVNKPAMMALHPAHGHYGDTLSDAVRQYYAQQMIALTVRAVGRLDRETSGIVIFAKNAVAAARLFRAKQRYRGSGEADQNRNPVSDREFLKYYLVLAEGSFAEEQFETDLPVRKAASVLNRMEAGNHLCGAKPAKTCFRVLRHFPEGYALLEALPVTGRTHQIRVHLSASGHPLLGDRIYGGIMDQGISRAALHCHKAVFCHPVTGEPLVLQAEPPEDFRKLMQGYERAANAPDVI